MDKLTKKEKELKAKDKMRNVAECLRNGHKTPVTRRDFISLGLLGATSSILAPSILSMLSSKVYAGDIVCPTQAAIGSSMLPFIVIDLAGGAPLCQDFMLGGRSGQMDLVAGPNGDNTKAYDVFGIPDALNYYKAPFNDEFGIRFHRDSSFLAGLKTGVTNTALFGSIDGAVIPVVLGSDTDQNPINPVQAIAQLGRSGILVPTVGTQGSKSGGNSAPAIGTTSPLYTPTKINSQNDASAVMTGGTLVQSLGSAKADGLRRKIASMTSSKLDAFSSLAINDQLKSLVDCNYLSMADLPNKFNATTFFTDANLNTAFGNNTSTAAVISKLLKEGAAGAATISLGGYDNHDNTASSMRNMNNQAGKLIGQIIRYFSLSNMGVVIAVISDGSMGTATIDATADTVTNGVVTTFGGGGFFSRPGDNDGTSMAAMLSYVPNKVRGDLVQMDGRQVGAVNSNGVDRTYLITSNNPTNTGLNIVYQYLLLHGMESTISKVTGGTTNPFGGINEPLYRVFKKAV
jgi:hypothetical protein